MNPELLIDYSGDELRKYQERFLQTSINTALPCTVEEVNGDRLTIRLNILREFQGVTQDALTLYDVPVVYPGSGTATVRFPITTGDTGLIIFAQRDIDNWLEGETATPNTTRLHDYSDGITLGIVLPKEGITWQLGDGFFTEHFIILKLLLHILRKIRIYRNRHSCRLRSKLWIKWCFSRII